MTIPTLHQSGTGIERLARRPAPPRIPQPVDGLPGLFVVDATWGTIAPIELASGVRTNRPTALFCNGPQCSATPEAATALLAARHPAHALRYYRGLPLHRHQPPKTRSR